MPSLTTAYSGVYATQNTDFGPIAQLGERFNGIEEVKGSSPFRSTGSLRIPVGTLVVNDLRKPPRHKITGKGLFASSGLNESPLPTVENRVRKGMLWQSKNGTYWMD